MIGGKLFTSYTYNNTIDKPVLYPLLTASGKIVTRGFPVAPRPFERTDHPHHIGLWFNYGDVNGLDFWNNSYAIKQEISRSMAASAIKKLKLPNQRRGPKKNSSAGRYRSWVQCLSLEFTVIATLSLQNSPPASVILNSNW